MLPFIKMHGLLNDFVILDGRNVPLHLSKNQLQTIGNRRSGVGCDQLILLSAPKEAQHHVSVRIFNQDGSEAMMCGNAMRCVTKLLSEELNQTSIFIETPTRVLECTAQNNLYTVNMGEWTLDNPNLEALTHQALGTPSTANMGNPHLVYFASPSKDFDFQSFGESVQKNPLFLNKINVSIAEVLNDHEIRLQTFERGVGLTPACGSAACAAAALSSYLQKTQSQVTVHMQGGDLQITLDGKTVFMTGPASKTFEGTLDLSDYN